MTFDPGQWPLTENITCNKVKWNLESHFDLVTLARAHLSFGMTPTQAIIKDLFTWCGQNLIDPCYNKLNTVRTIIPFLGLQMISHDQNLNTHPSQNQPSNEFKTFFIFVNWSLIKCTCMLIRGKVAKLPKIIVICYILTKAFLSIVTDRAFSSSCNLCDNTVFVTSDAMADACSICAISSPVGTNNAGLSNTSFILEIS